VNQPFEEGRVLHTQVLQQLVSNWDANKKNAEAEQVRDFRELIDHLGVPW
jgi:hypothetical protein